MAGRSQTTALLQATVVPSQAWADMEDDGEEIFEMPWLLPSASATNIPTSTAPPAATAATTRTPAAARTSESTAVPEISEEPWHLPPPFATNVPTYPTAPATVAATSSTPAAAVTSESTTMPDIVVSPPAEPATAQADVDVEAKVVEDKKDKVATVAKKDPRAFFDDSKRIKLAPGEKYPASFFEGHRQAILQFMLNHKDPSRSFESRIRVLQGGAPARVTVADVKSHEKAWRLRGLRGRPYWCIDDTNQRESDAMKLRLRLGATAATVLDEYQSMRAQFEAKEAALRYDGTWIHDIQVLEDLRALDDLQIELDEYEQEYIQRELQLLDELDRQDDLAARHAARPSTPISKQANQHNGRVGRPLTPPNELEEIAECQEEDTGVCVGGARTNPHVDMQDEQSSKTQLDAPKEGAGRQEGANDTRQVDTGTQALLDLDAFAGLIADAEIDRLGANYIARALQQLNATAAGHWTQDGEVDLGEERYGYDDEAGDMPPTPPTELDDTVKGIADDAQSCRALPLKRATDKTQAIAPSRPLDGEAPFAHDDPVEAAGLPQSDASFDKSLQYETAERGCNLEPVIDTPSAEDEDELERELERAWILFEEDMAVERAAEAAADKTRFLQGSAMMYLMDLYSSAAALLKRCKLHRVARDGIDENLLERDDHLLEID